MVAADRSRIAFLAAGVGGEPDLYLIDVDGSGLDAVTDSSEGESLPVWSPDGTKIAYPRMLDSYNKGDLEILDVTAGRVIVLKGANVTHDAPVWSPDGTHVLATVYTRPDNPEHVSSYDTLGIFDVTNGSDPVMISVPGLRSASWQRLAP